MSRKPRKYIIAPNSFYHIVSRGNNQRRIFRSGRDYKKFLSILEKTKEKYPFYFYSYNFLPNHYHLAIETREIPVSKIMHQINSTYVKYFRKRYGGVGHLFQGRFFSALVEKDIYFWALVRYIDLNAVEVGLAKKPEDYPWSSYSIYCQKEYSGKLIDREKFLRYGGENLEQSRLSYLKFIQEERKSKKKLPFSLSENML